MTLAVSPSTDDGDRAGMYDPPIHTLRENQMLTRILALAAAIGLALAPAAGADNKKPKGKPKGKPEQTQTSQAGPKAGAPTSGEKFFEVESGCSFPSKYAFCAYQQGPQASTQPTSRSSPKMCRIMSSGVTPSVGLS